jgi:hypothetical protein
MGNGFGGESIYGDKFEDETFKVQFYSFTVTLWGVRLRESACKRLPLFMV